MAEPPTLGLEPDLENSTKKVYKPCPGRTWKLKLNYMLTQLFIAPQSLWQSYKQTLKMSLLWHIMALGASCNNLRLITYT